MKIVVVGSGGVGGYFGARLAAAGNEVTFVARGAHLEAMRKAGLRVQSPLGDVSLAQVRTASSARDVDSADFVLVAVKLWDLDAVAPSLLPLADRGAAVVSLQNGVQKDEVLERFLPRGSILGGVCYISASIAEPGVIRHVGAMQRIVIGEYGGQPSDRVRAFESAARKAGIEIEASAEIEKVIWQKFIFLVGLSASTAAIRQPIGPIRDNPQARGFLLDLVAETTEVARAKGIRLPQDFPAQQMAAFDRLPAEMAASMLHDLNQGNRLELPWLSGAVVELGSRLGVPTPRNRAVSDILAIYSGRNVSS